MTDFALIMPEIFLALTLAFLIFGEITYHGERVRLIHLTGLVGLAAAFVQTILAYQYGTTQAFNQALAIDGFSLFFKLFFIVLAFLAVLNSWHTAEIVRDKAAEYSALIVASSLAMCLAASAADMLLAFLSLQFMNVLAYFLAGYGKKSMRSVEAAVKYMIFSVVSAGLLLYGLAILFAHTQTLNIYQMHRALLANGLSQESMLVAFVLIFLSFGFQMASFPMYFWAPDVLEGAPTPASGFLSVGTRAAGIAVAVRFFVVVFAQPALAQGQWQVLGSVDWTRIVGFASGASMLVGSLLALRQTGAKRLVGSLLIASTGFLLMGILVLDQIGLAAILYNLLVELFAVVGVYYVLSYLFDQLQSDQLPKLNGMMGKSVVECICLVLFLLCLVGVPPLPGFIGKFTLIGAAVRHHWWSLATIAVFAMGVSTIAVARLAYGLIGDVRTTIEAPFVTSGTRTRFLAAVLAPLLLLGIFAEPVLDWVGKSLGFILW